MAPRRASLLAVTAAAAAALLLVCAATPAAAQASAGTRMAFNAILAPLPNTTGVDLPGSGFARVEFDASSDASKRGENTFMLSTSDLVRSAHFCVTWHTCCVRSKPAGKRMRAFACAR
jgi:hypothetical protein